MWVETSAFDLRAVIQTYLLTSSKKFKNHVWPWIKDVGSYLCLEKWQMSKKNHKTS